ncbi:rod shape-determining protein MreC [Coxiella endosymbiont of Amblyomma americanum]|uniref:rod shape-determining protein MreC n=1 Tax=Coxiella endosymbiont of Amblyomma americanum TaxID=325775 RepID=UPI00210FDF16|nr:rod shape-determining protein MreC [Coxiella endosymbiont of Amblyomma americanum]
MFKRSSVSALRAISYVGLSVILIVFDYKTEFFHKIRNDLSLIILPIQYVVDTPIKIINWISTNTATQRQLITENMYLRAHAQLLELKLQKFLFIQRENVQLRKLLKFTSQMHNTSRVLVAQLLSINLDPNLQKVVIDKGLRSHIYIGQPVLDVNGIVGQVVDANLLTSEIMLISDPKSAIPVQNNRNGIRAVAIGMGSSSKLMVINIFPYTNDIKKGDLFISSGLGSRYPVGYPVGTVTDVMTYNSSKRFTKIILRPSARLDQLQQVLMIWPSDI